jgi:hypothetical protein
MCGALLLLSIAHSQCEIEQRAKAVFERCITLDLAAVLKQSDVAPP